MNLCHKNLDKNVWIRIFRMVGGLYFEEVLFCL